MMYRKGRDGFVLVYVFFLLFIIGGMVLVYNQSLRHRDVQIRLNTDRTHARFLARSGIELLLYAAREAQDPTQLKSPNLTGGGLLPFVLNTSTEIEKRVAAGASSDDDSRELLAQLLGKDALEPIDKLAKSLPAATIQLTLTMDASDPSSGVIRDVALKTIRVSIRSEARVRKAEETYETSETWYVHSTLPAAASKFTLAMLSPPGAPNASQVTTTGDDAGGTAPIVLFHHPDDCNPMAQDPFRKDETNQKPLTTTPMEPANMQERLVDRGLTGLGGVQRLKLASGGTPFGEYHAALPPTGGKVSYPQASRLPEQPEPISKLHPVDPVDPLVRQAGFVQGTVFGHFLDIDENELLGPAPTDGGADAVSQIKIHGTGVNPSPGLMIGETYRVMAGISDIAVDRDMSGRDEADQAATAGRSLPEREGIDPFLKNADEGTYNAAVSLEQAGPVFSYQGMTSFGNHGLINNLNLMVDSNADGIPDQTVMSEIAHNPVRLPLDEWQYRKCFKDYADYQRYMCKFVTFPANFSLNIGGLPPEQAAGVLRELAFGKTPPPGLDAFVMRDVKLLHRDAVHRSMTGKDHDVYADTAGVGADALLEAARTGLQNRWPTEIPFVVLGQKNFEKLFMVGDQIDLQGRRVQVVTVESEPAPLTFDRVVSVKPGSGGVLETPIFRCKGLLNAGLRDAFAPLVIKTAQLILVGRGPFEAVFVPGSVKQESVTNYSVVKGSLALTSLPGGSDLVRPLIVSYDPRLDPTADSNSLYYRIGFDLPPEAHEWKERQ